MSDASSYVTLTGTQTLTNKTLTSNTNDIRASEIGTTGASVIVDLSAPPIAGQVLVASGATNASWQTPTASEVTLNGVETLTNKTLIRRIGHKYGFNRTNAAITSLGNNDLNSLVLDWNEFCTGGTHCGIGYSVY